MLSTVSRVKRRGSEQKRLIVIVTQNLIHTIKMLTLSKCRRNFNFLKKSSSNTFEVSKVELLHVNLIAQHNLPFSLADHLSKIYPVVFPDSKIAKSFSCVERKLNGAMLLELKPDVVSRMKAEPYSLVNDGTSDTSIKK